MKFYCVGILALMGVAAFAADVTPLDVKPGEWETTMTMQLSGGATAAVPNIPPETLAKLPPEQRAKIEAALKTASGQPTTTVSKRCVKKEDTTKPMTMGADRANCKETLVNSTRTKQEIHIECEDKGTKSSGTIHLEAVNSENVKLDMQITSISRGQTININNTATSKWLGEACTEKQ